MKNEEQQELRQIDEDFGTGIYVSFKDGETHNLLITNWGVYDKEIEPGEKKLSFRCDVLNLDGREYLLGKKIIDTTSMAFHKEIKPFIINADAQKVKELHLEISRKGEKRNTTFFITKVGSKKNDK